MIKAVWWILLGIAINAGYLALRHSFGYTAGEFLPGPEDRFADLVKVALSFRHETDEILATGAFQRWPAIYQNYILQNPYHGVDGLAAGHLSHFHQLPLSQLSFNLAAKLIAASASPNLALWVWFGVFATAIAWLAKISTEDTAGRLALGLAIILTCLISYPALCVVIRGNYHAGFASVLSAVFLHDCLVRRKLSWPTCLALALAINFRPVALIFIAALPLSLGLRGSFRPITRVFAITGVVFVMALFWEHSLYPEYDAEHFLKGLEIYNNLYVLGSLGDGGNASLWGLVKNGTRMADVYMYHNEMSRIYLALSLLTCCLAWRAIQTNPDASTIAFVLVVLYVLLPPICTEYHLLVLVAPLIIISNTNRNNNISGQVIAHQEIIYYATLFTLIPKNFSYLDGLSVQSIINPAILLLALFLLQSRSGMTRTDTARALS